MASDLEQSVQRIGEKARILVERYRVVEQEKAEALRRVADLERQLDIQRKENERLRMQTEFLTVSSAIAPDPDSVEHARAIVADLLSEVDRCIADLHD